MECSASATRGVEVKQRQTQRAEERLSRLTTALHQAQRKKHEWPEKRQPIDKSDTTSRETHLSKTKPIFEDDLFRMSLLVLCFKLFITTLYILTTVHRLNAENEEFSNIVSILLGWHHLHYCWKHWFQ